MPSDVSAVVADLSRRQAAAPTAGDVAAALGISRQHARRLLHACPGVFFVDTRPPRWYCREALPEHVAALRDAIARALDVARGMDPEAAYALVREHLDAQARGVRA